MAVPDNTEHARRLFAMSVPGMAWRAHRPREHGRISLGLLRIAPKSNPSTRVPGTDCTENRVDLAASVALHSKKQALTL
eukprot:1678959-Rhodomonas_salina.3